MSGLAVALVLVCGLPYVVAALFGPTDLVGIGTFWFASDFSQYQAAMREGGQQTGWLIHDHLSAEPHQPALMYPLYVGAGKLAAATSVGDLAIFRGLEWLGRLAVLLALYGFAATFVAERRQRRLAMLLALGTLGLDAWMVPLRILLSTTILQPIAEGLPQSVNPYLEVSSFGVLLSAPHLMFGLALTLAAAPLYVRAIARPGPGRWAVLGGAVLAVSLVHPFNIPVLVSVLAAHALLTGRRAWPAAIVAAAAAAPMALYNLLLYHADAFWSGTYNAQNLMPAPAPWALPFDFGLVALAAPLAWPIVRRWPTEQQRLMGLWIGLALIWMYAPLPYQRRFAFGAQPALAVLAGVGLIEINETLRRHGGWLARRAVNYALVLAAASTSLLVYVSLVASALTDKPVGVYLWTRPEAEAASWLSGHTNAADVVLASTDFANPLAGVIDGRVVQGHLVATLHAEQKAALVARFYAAETSLDQRVAALHESEATYVAFGPHERALGVATLTDVAGLDQVYERDGVALFKVL